MGVLYSVIPLAPDMAEWLEEQGVVFPKDAVGRNPTPREVRTATSDLDGFVVEYNGADDFTQVDIHSPNAEEGPWTLLNIVSPTGPDDPAEVYFEKGWPEAIVPVVIRLSLFTGPLLLLADTGEAPVVVTHEKSTDTVLAEWEHTAAIEGEDEDEDWQ